MTAIPLHRSPPPPAAAASWVPLGEAARLLDKSEGHVRRLAARLAERGLARKIGNSWMVSVAASPRLLRASVERTASGGSIVNELLKLAPDPKRREAESRAHAVIDFRRWRARSDVQLKRDLPAFLEAAAKRHGLAVTRSTLYAWDKRCPTSDDFAGCVAALLDSRGRPRTGGTSISDTAWEFFCSVYLTPNQLSIKHCWEITRTRSESEGWAWPSLSRCKQLVRERLDPGVITLRRDGHEAWAKRHLAPMEQDPEAWAAGQCWEADHTDFDFSVRVFAGGEWRAVRPRLTAWLDRRSRRLVGWHVSEQGNQGTIRLALLDALKREGVSVPEIVWLDNGKDFCAASVGGLTKAERRGMTRDEQREAEARATGILRMLSIEPHFARPYNHNGKARIERFFGTMHQRFDREFDSWCGSRPGMIDRRELNARLRDVMSLPTLGELRERFAAWAEWYNHRADHEIGDLVDAGTGERLSPLEWYERFLPAMRAVDKRSLPLLGQVWSRPLKVHKHGVSIELAGKVIRFGEMLPRLEVLVGTERRVYVSFDPADTSHAEVWDEQFRHVCTARENGRHGGLVGDAVTQADRKAAHAARREQLRRARERVDLATLSLSDAELASRAAREREIAETRARLKEAGVGDPPPIRLVATPVDGQAPEQGRMRKAAGAEHYPDDEAEEFDLSRLEVVRPGDDSDDDDAFEFESADEDEADDDDLVYEPRAEAREFDPDDDDPTDALVIEPEWAGDDEGDILLEIE